MSKKIGKPKGRPKGTPNIHRSAEEKERIVLEWRKTSQSQRSFCHCRGLNHRLFSVWNQKYEKDGLEGLRSKTGESGSGNVISALYHSKKLTTSTFLSSDTCIGSITSVRLIHSNIKPPSNTEWNGGSKWLFLLVQFCLTSSRNDGFFSYQ